MQRKLEFNSNNRHTIGIELEFGLVDSQTMALSSSIDDLLKHFEGRERSFKPELMQCCLEINTDICEDIGRLVTICEARSPKWRK